MDTQEIKVRGREIGDELDRLERERERANAKLDKRIGELREEQRALNSERTDQALGRNVKKQMDAASLRMWQNVRL